MAKNRQPSPVADFLAAALAPALVMGMIYCLISFLILVFYRDGFQVRVNYLFALYIFASVLIARIAIDSGRAYALGYTLALGASTLFVISRFVVFDGPLASLSPLINAGLLALVGFLADRIVFDCTLIESDRDTSGEGLLQSLGLVRSDLATSPVGKAKRQRRHNPGVSILYFALLAIPLYGVGQLFLPSDAVNVRERAFYLLFGYFACSFSLLVTTSFLGLRRYLGQRGVEIPLEFTATWLGMGLLGTLLFLSLCMLLPLPGREFGLFELPFDIKSSQGLTASRYGWGGEGTGDGAGGTPTAPYPSPGSPSNVGPSGSAGTMGNSDGEGGSAGSSGGESTQTGQTQGSNGSAGPQGSNSGVRSPESQGSDPQENTSNSTSRQPQSSGSNRPTEGTSPTHGESKSGASSQGATGQRGQESPSSNRQDGAKSNTNQDAGSKSGNTSPATDSQSQEAGKRNGNTASESMNNSGKQNNSGDSQQGNGEKNSPNAQSPSSKANQQSSSQASDRRAESNSSNSPTDNANQTETQSRNDNPSDRSSSDSQSPEDRSQAQSPSQQNNSRNEQAQSNQSRSEQPQNAKQQNGESQNAKQENAAQQDTSQENTSQENTEQQNTEQQNTEQQNTEQQESEKSEQTQSESSPPAQPQEPWLNFDIGSWVGPLFKWLTIFALLGFIVYYAITHREEIRNWWAGVKAWWNNLWGLNGEEDSDPNGAQASSKRQQRARFSSYSNPFRSRNQKQDSSELVRYTYAAVEAWGAERGVVRAEGQTAEEYLLRLSGALPKCQGELANLSVAYTKLAYAGRKAILVDMQSLQKLWAVMEQIAATPSTNPAV